MLKGNAPPRCYDEQALPPMKALLALLLATTTATCGFAQSDTRFQEFQPAKITQTVDPFYPDSLVATHRRGGEVILLVSLDETGRPTDYLPVRSTDPLFAESAINAVKQWKFDPARDRGEPVPVTVELKFMFVVRGAVVSVTASEILEANFNEITGVHEYAPCTLRELDRIPVPLQTVSPVYPEELARLGAVGEVTVDFYIDERGAVRMPYVSSHAQPLLARLAVDAVRQWKFEPPTRRGRPVLVHVRQLFRFRAPVAAKN